VNSKIIGPGFVHCFSLCLSPSISLSLYFSHCSAPSSHSAVHRLSLFLCLFISVSPSLSPFHLLCFLSLFLTLQAASYCILISPSLPPPFSPAIFISSLSQQFSSLCLPLSLPLSLPPGLPKPLSVSPPVLSLPLPHYPGCFLYSSLTLCLHYSPLLSLSLLYPNGSPLYVFHSPSLCVFPFVSRVMLRISLCIFPSVSLSTFLCCSSFHPLSVRSTVCVPHLVFPPLSSLFLPNIWEKLDFPTFEE
jgi:hypothetical protein